MGFAQLIEPYDFNNRQPSTPANLGETVAPQPQQPMQPVGQDNEKAQIFMKYAQKAAMAGLNTDADNFLAIAKSLGGGASSQAKPFDANTDMDVFAATTQDVHKGDITTQDGYNKFIKWWGTPEGKKSWADFNTNKYKNTTASEMFGTDNKWWRTNPNTGKKEYYGINKQGNYDWVYDPKMPVPMAVPKELGRTPASAIEKGVTLDQIAGNIDRINTNYKPEWVGPVEGRLSSIKEQTVGLEDPNKSAFYADVRDLGDMLLRARSGAQINEQEMKRLEKLIPTPNLPPATFEARKKRFSEQFMQAIKAWENRQSGSRYMVPERSTQTNAVERSIGGEPQDPASAQSAGWRLVEKNGKKGYVSPDGTKVIPVR